MLCLFLTLLVELFTGGESARYARFQEDYVPAIGDFATNGNVVYLGAKAKILKLHFARREFVAQFEVLSSKCPVGDDLCSDYTQHVLLADGRIFGVSYIPCILSNYYNHRLLVTSLCKMLHSINTVRKTTLELIRSKDILIP